MANARFSVRLTPEELEALDRAAAGEGLARAEFARKALLTAIGVPFVPLGVGLAARGYPSEAKSSEAQRSRARAKRGPRGKAKASGGETPEGVSV